MDWDILDFVVFGTLIGSVGGLYWLTTRASSDRAYRAAVAVALTAAFLLVWINGAVGIIGPAGHDANLLFLGVLAVGLTGSLIARFRPGGMALTLVAMAAAQALIAAAALVAGWGASGATWPSDIVVLTGFFVALWLLAAWLFRSADRQPVAHD